MSVALPAHHLDTLIGFKIPRGFERHSCLSIFSDPIPRELCAISVLRINLHFILKELIMQHVRLNYL